jgi:Tol biopolymer transport system component
VVDDPAQYVGFAFSPDARQLVFSRAGRNGGADIWLRDLGRGSERRLTFDGAAFTPQWSPDGTRIVFTGPGQSPPPKLFVRTIAGTGAASRLGDSATPNFASSWSGDGHSIVSVRMDPVTHNDLWTQRLQDGRGERLPFNTSFNESDGKVSPDGGWIAYVTDESGRDEVWVASFPSGTTRQQVSVRGGTLPTWSNASNELYYVSNDKQLMAVRFSGGHAGVKAGTPQRLFQVSDLAEVDRLIFPTSNAYLAAATGQRFLVAVKARDPNASPISVVVNWRALLKH